MALARGQQLYTKCSEWMRFATPNKMSAQQMKTERTHDETGAMNKIKIVTHHC